ncbi:hypothetical protein EYB26_002507 [Talaromyces marneffei]|nr:uncharacterized protein EYB26_002507 [Talaromyces marneffei]QGA14851.1 hypothetical protein EYB26_002507 [Talaromyces marneffei]
MSCLDSSPEHFINTFITTDKSGFERWYRDSSAAKQKRSHCKSRTGCLTCRQRKVKCDENLPTCHRCMKRGDVCRRRPARQQQQPFRFHDRDSQRRSHSSPCLSTSSISTPILSGDGALNMEQLRLFHHFQSSTQHTLPVIGQIWESVLPKAFEYEYLMQAALCLAARHLEYSCGHEDEVGQITLSRKYLSHTLRLFRKALSSGITDSNRDAVLCTSFMLYFEAWSDTAFLLSDNNTDISTSAYSVSEDQLFTLAKSMRHVCMYAMSDLAHNSSVLRNVMLHRPIWSIYQSLSFVGRVCDEYHAFFEQLWRLDGDPVIFSKFCDIPPPQIFRHGDGFPGADIIKWTEHLSTDRHDAYIHVANRLSALLSLLPIDAQEIPERSVLEICPDLLPDVSRVVFTFPIMFHPEFTDMLFENDTRILVLLYHFFRMVNRLLPKDECWWAARRAESFEVFLRRKLWG